MAEICNGRLSYTDPKFTKVQTFLEENKIELVELERFLNQQKFQKVIDNSLNRKCTIVIDWLSVLFRSNMNKNIPAPQTEKEEFSHKVNDDIVLTYYGKGNEHYKYIWHVYVRGQHLATMLSHTRNAKFVRDGMVKVDFKNHLLYSDQLWPVYNELVDALDLHYKNVSRVDIALDGLNYLVDFMNYYVKQTLENKVVEFKGRPDVQPRVLYRKSMKFQNFMIGKPGSRVYMTIYNKSLEIVKSRKEYIQEFWKQNGILKQSLPIEMLAKAMKGEQERYYLEGYENIFRFEARIKGEALTQIHKFNIGMLQTTSGLISIVKLMVNNFFEAVWLTDINISRCDNIPLIPFDQFEIVPLAKIALLERDDLYKTKLSINKNVRQLYTGHLSPDNASVYEMLIFDINQFRLQKWFVDKYHNEWKNKYSKLNRDQEHVLLVHELINQVIEEMHPETEVEAIEEFL